MRTQSTLSFAYRSLISRLNQHRLLLLTMLGSVVLHIVLMTEFTIDLPQLFENKQTLEMRLVQQQIEPSTKTTPDKKIEEDKKPKAAQKQPESAPVIDPVARETVDPEVVSATEVPIPASENASETIAETDISQSDEIADANLPGANEENVPEKMAYTHVETEFEVTRGINTSVAGTTKTIFNIDENGRYSIVSITQAKGLASLIFGNLTQKSEGLVTENGLKPDFYSYQYGDNAKKSQTANFNWNDGVLHMHTYKGDSTANLAADTQDFLSFMYQFMYTPPLETMQITMTNGKRLRTYTYTFEGEETISTKLGELKTIHLLKGSTDEDKTEIWLATDYQYLPVKIRKTEKDGTVIEQIVANIQIEPVNPPIN
jgi:hypothetical protein